MDDYYKKALDLAHDQDTLKGLRTSLRNQLLSSPLCDSQTYIKEVELIYRNLWREWCKDTPLPPSRGEFN